MTERPPLPPLWRAELRADQVAELFTDLEAATLLSVVVRDATQATTRTPARLTLSQAREALSAGRPVQLRYQWQGAEWWDTLTPGSNGIRLVRIRH